MVDLSWSEPDGWWRDAKGNATISRNGLLAKWTLLTPGPLDRDLFASEIVGWSQPLGRAVWVKAKYGPQAATRLYRSVKIATDEPQLWNKISAVYREYGDALARYTSGVVTEFVDDRPTKMDRKIHDAVRDKIRGLTVTLRTNLCGRNWQPGLILESEQSTASFLADTAHVDNSREWAAEAAVHRVQTYLALNQAILSPADAQTLTTWVDARARKYGLPTAPIAAAQPTPFTAAQLRAVDDRLVDEVAADPSYYFETGKPAGAGILNVHLDAGRPAQLAKAWERAQKTLLRKLQQGVDITPEVVRRVLRRKLLDLWIEYWRDPKRDREELSIDGEEGDHSASAAPDTYDEVLDRAIWTAVDRALTIPMKEFPADCWELTTARRLIQEPRDVLQVVDVISTIRPLVVALWQSTDHRTAIATNSKAAAENVERILRMGISAVVGDAPDFASLGGRPLESQLSRIDNILTTYQEQFAQQIDVWSWDRRRIGPKGTLS